jgi:hypothetical protein
MRFAACVRQACELDFPASTEAGLLASIKLMLDPHRTGHSGPWIQDAFDAVRAAHRVAHVVEWTGAWTLGFSAKDVQKPQAALMWSQIIHRVPFR